MKRYLPLLLIVFTIPAFAQQENAAPAKPAPSEYKYHSVIATLSLGFLDFYRQNYSLPIGFSKGNTSGFTPMYAKLEYGLYKNISIGATFCYDAFYYNYKQNFTGNNGPFYRYITNNTRVFSGGVAAFYHLGNIVHIRHLDPFIGLGISLNNIRYGSYPQGDSTLVKLDHTITPYLKAGARYYLSPHYSLFADVGYDQQSWFSLGASCRFGPRKK